MVNRDLAEIIEFIEAAQNALAHSPSYRHDPNLFEGVDLLAKAIKMIVDNIAYERARNE